MISINEHSAAIVREMIVRAEELRLEVTGLSGGATIIDAGVHAPGSPEAGRLFSEACLGGLGQVGFCTLDYGDFWLPGVSVHVNHPAIACLASQYAGWAIRRGQFFAMGSGPIRALYCGEPLFDRLGYEDQAQVGVLLLESRSLPTDQVAEWIAAKAGLSPRQIYILVAPTASVVGSIQIAARVVETGMHKMLEVGFDVNTVIAGYGTCPLAPIAESDLRAIGRTNDAVLYGGRAWYTVQADEARISEMIERLPSSASHDYGTPFSELFKQYGGDFYSIDPLLFSPAQVAINEVNSGRTFCAGMVNRDMLQKTLLQ